jgi:ATP-dependent protease ClpP protease subunit
MSGVYPRALRFNNTAVPVKYEGPRAAEARRIRAYLRENAQRSWYRIENVTTVDGDTDRARVYIFEEIGMWGCSAAEFVLEMAAITASHIDLHLSSPGGEVFDGIDIYNAIVDHPAEVTVHIGALAASAASFIAQAGDRVLISRNGSMMIHDAMSIAIGNAAEMRREADLLDMVSENIASIYAQRAGGQVSGWRAAMQQETWYTAEQAVSAGLADAIEGDDDSDEDESGEGMFSQSAAAAWDVSIFARRSPDNPAPQPAAAPAPAAAPTRPSARRRPAAARFPDTPRPAPADAPADAPAPASAPTAQEPQSFVLPREPRPPAPPPPPLDFTALADSFRAGVSAGVPREQPTAFDAGVFRGAMNLVASDAPATPSSPAAAPAAPADPQEPAPQPEPDPGPFDRELFRGVVAAVATDAPAPRPAPQPAAAAPAPPAAPAPVDEPDEPEPLSVGELLRAAVLNATTNLPAPDPEPEPTAPEPPPQFGLNPTDFARSVREARL